MRSNTVVGLGIAAVLIVALLGLGIYAYEHIVVTGSGAAINGEDQSPASPAISAFAVEQPNFVAEGTTLAKVEIWAVPTGTGVTEANYQLLGTATLRSGDISGGAQVWTLPIPAQPVLATQIFAKGFDANGAEVARVSLPYVGASALYDAIWGSGATSTGTTASGSGTTASTTDQSQRNFSFTLAVGQKATVGNLTVKLIEVSSDSRCPQNAVCIWAGEVTAQVELISGAKDQLVELRSSGTPVSFANYSISMVGVTPARKTGATLSQRDYRIEFSVERI